MSSRVSLLLVWMRHKVLLWLLGSVTDTLHCILTCRAGDTGGVESTLWWFWPVLAIDTPPVVWSCQSVTRQSEEPVHIYYAARILWILNTYRPQILWIHTCVCGLLTAYQHIQQTPNSGQHTTASRWIQFQNLGYALLHTSFLGTMPTAALFSQMSTSPI